MTIPKEIIEFAIEGGLGGHTRYKANMDAKTWADQVEVIYQGFKSQGNALVLDPDFWSALGKAKGWTKYVWLSYGDYRYGSHNNIDFTDDERFTPPTKSTDTPYANRFITSQYYAHQFFDLLVTNGDTAAFWANLK